MTVRLVLDCRCTLGECPVWSVAEQALHFVDIKAMDLHRFEPAAGRHTTVRLAEEVGCIGLAEAGGFVAALRTGIWLLDARGERVTFLAENPEPHATNRFNDGRTDPRGRFWLGTIDETRRGTASLYRLDARGLTRVEGGLTTSNGLAFAPDGRTMYHADTPRRTIFAYAYDPDTGEAADRRVFATIPETVVDRGRPDGGAVDAEGCYWSALWEGERVRRYSPAGEVLTDIAVPSRCPTMLAFGGPELRTLYVTSARGGRPDDELDRLPHSGGLFALDVDVPGLPEPLFDPLAA